MSFTPLRSVKATGALSVGSRTNAWVKSRKYDLLFQKEMM
jgi:hypothetical protein